MRFLSKFHQHPFALLLVLALYMYHLAPEVFAEIRSSSGELNRVKQNASGGARAHLRFTPLSLTGGSKLTIVSPKEWHTLGNRLSISVQKTHQFFTNLFGEIPAFTTSLRLMDEEAFYAETGAPRWTNAMYYRNEIIIPLGEGDTVNVEHIARSIRHEYTHAVVHALSKGKCPGWLDEGLAQWAEGSENPALRPALHDWLTSNRPVPLDLLQGGFTKLSADMVPAAYAQSLFAANTIVNNYGFEKFRSYLDHLRNGASKPRAFRQSFRVSESEFEGRLGDALSTWHKRHFHAYKGGR